MAGRGGRGGRGGRFGRGGNSATHDLIRDNLEDLGIDAYGSMMEEDRTPPPLYPAINLPESRPPDESDISSLTRARTVAYRLQNSAYFMNRTGPDTMSGLVMPGSDIDVAWQMWSSKGDVPEEWREYAPQELFVANIKGKSNKKKELNFNSLEQAEKSGKNGEDNEDEEVDTFDSEMEQEEEDEGDYNIDHYASDGGDDNDDDEAIF